MKISKVLLWIGVLWMVVAAQASWAASITNCTQVIQAAPDDINSTPNNLGATPAENDESCVTITLQDDSYDLGDAPDPSYATLLSSNGARHIQKDNTLHLGSCVDKDEDGQPNSDALGDDTGNGASVVGTCANGDDEDGVTFTDLKVGAQDVTINVAANKACRLNAWVDWSGNGTWGDVGDQIATDQLLAIGNNTLTLDVPASARPGATYARFRCSTAGGDGVTGEAADGEIEDYRITIAAAVPKIDLKKYVQNKAGAPAYDNANESATLGDDAQEFVSGLILPYGSDALYRIRVENTGSTKLNEVTVDDQIEACDPLTKIYDSNAATPNGTMSQGEVWVLECTLPALKQDIVNTAKVRGIPVNEDDTPTGQSPVDSHDPANVRIPVNQPAISLKKYVVAGGTDNDAQDAGKAVMINAGATVNYKFVITNIGNTILGNIDLEEQLEDCVVGAVSGDTGNDARMAVGEAWTYTCSKANVRVDTQNYATVIGTPVNPDGTPTGQSPVNDGDPANVRITLGQPAIELKKYVRPVGAAAGAATEKDAEDMSAALVVDHNASVTYRMVVRNVGNTPLTNVVLTEHMDGCAVAQTVGAGDTLLDPNEFWEYECTKANMVVAMENIADVEAKPANPDGTPTTQSPVRDLDPANVKLREGAPAISLKKYVVANGTDNDAQDAAAAVMIDAGATVNYKLVVTNTGNTALGTVDVQDNLTGCNLSTVAGDSGNDSIMSVGEVWTYTCSVANMRVDTLNLATVTAKPVNADGTPTNQSPVSSEDPANVRVRVERPAISLKKYVRVDGTPENTEVDAQDMGAALMVSHGDKVTYRMVVTNTGNSLLAEVVLDDQLEGCTNPVRTDTSNADAFLSPNEAWVYQCTGVVTKVDTYNLATVTAKPANADGTPTTQSPVSDEDPANVRITLGQPAIELKKYVRPVAAAAGSAQELDAEDMSAALVVDHKASVTYRMVVRNVGNTPLTSVVLTEHMDGCAVTKTVGVGDTLLDPAEFWEYECTKANMVVAMENIADVEAKPANPDGTPTTQSPVRDLDPANVKLREGAPAISLKKYVVANGTDNDAQDAAAAVMIDAGATVNYKLVVTNTGNTALGTVDVQDNLTGCNLSTVAGDSGNDSIMSVGEVWTYTCSVANMRVDTLNLATVTAKPVNADGTPTNQSPVSSEDPANVRVRVERPAISLKKYVRVDGTPENTEVDAQDMGAALMVSHGDKVTYRMVVTNTGNSLLADVVLDDQLEGCTNPVRTDTSNADAFLSPNEAWVYQCTGVVTKVDTYNLATVTAKPANADGTPTTQSPVSDEDPANVRIRINQPAISLKKYVVAGGVDNDAQDAGKAVMINAGATVNYKLVATNIGNTALGSVVLDEQLADCAVSAPQGDTGNDARMAVGEVWTYTCSKANVREDTHNYATVVATPVNADGTPTGQSPVNDGDPANVRITLGQPAIELKKYVRPVGAAAGAATEKDAEDMSAALVVDHNASVTYRMVVRNIGNTPLTNVVLTEHMDGCAVAQTVGAGDTLLDPNEFWEYECTKANMIVAMENIADVEAKPANPDGTPTTQSPVRDLDPANVKLREGAPAISLKKYVVANGTDNDAQDAAAAVMVDAGATVNYKLVATNTGNTALGTVDVQDNLTGCNLSTVAGDTGSDSIMSMGEVWTYTCSVADVRVDTLNLATVTAKPVNADGTPTNQSQVSSEDPANVRIPLGQPAIELKKYVQNAATAPAFNAATPLVGLGQEAQDMSTAVVLPHGATAMYRMVVTNIGNTPLAQVQLTEHLEGCAVNRVYNGDADAKDLLKSGEFWIYQCTKANITLDMQNVASVEAKPANPDGSLTTQSPVDDEDPANVRIGQNLPAIELIKYVRKAGDPAPGNDAQDNLHALPVKHGDNVTYRIEVRNTGSTALASVKVDDHLPDCNLPSKPVSGDAGTTDLLETGEVWIYECNQNNVTTDVYNLATVTAVPAHANGTPTGQSPVNDEDPANVSIPLAQPAIALQKYVRLEGTPAPGSDAQDALHALLVNHNSNVIYRIVVRNTGNTALANVDVEDSLEGCDLPTNPVGDDGDKLLETGELWSYECTQTGVTTDVYNLATVVAQPAHDNGTPTTQSPVMAQDAANVRIPSKQPALELKKYVRLDGTAAPGIDAQDNLNALLVKHGDTVTYRITVRNTGSTALSNVKVDDHLRDCTLPDSPQSGDNGNDLLDTGELWVYECSQADVTQDVYNLATVVATPANADGSPTGQSPITDEDPANVRIPLAQPAIELKKYVRVAGTAVGTELDAQDASAALMVEHNTNVTYRITVRNLGNALLGDVKVDDHLENCALAPVDLGDLDAANTLKQGETWSFECTQTGVKVDTYNLATVEAVPLHDDGTPTNQSPVDDEDPANVRIRKELPAISLKKYVRPQGAAAPGNDAQDALHAETVAYGSNVTYRIEVRNIGKTPLINVKVDDHLEACNLPANPQSGDTGNDGKLDLTEVWVYECDQTNVTTDVYNLATVEAVPANADGTPTNQSPVDDEDPANVHVQVTGPAITLKKYVQPAANAPAYDANNSATLGLDAQDTLHAQMLEFGNTALFRTVVKNTGTTWLDSVKVEDHLDTCNPFTRIHSSVNNDEVMSPGEFWVYECSVPNVTENLANLASVEARPVQEDGKPTGQSPVDAKDMANVMIPVKQPAIAMKKYVRKVGDAAPGNDAQDNLNALTVAHGENVIYHIEVRNIGDTVLGYVKVDDYLKDCALNPLSLADGDNLLGINEAWTYECTQANVTQDVYNLAAVEATPVFANGTPTGQSPVDAKDPANVRIPLDGPSITVKKYVQAAAGAQAYVSGNVATLGKDAQDATTAAYVQYDSDALYRIVVKNTGTTWLDQVTVDDSIENCAVTRIDRGDNDVNDTLKPDESWVYECQLAKVNEDIRNLATASARPIHADMAPTGQSPVSSSDPAHVTTELAPKIALKKYVQAADGALVYNALDDATLGFDAQDASAATFITKDKSALYRITVTNTGNTWLDQVVVDDQLTNCAISNIDQGDNDAAKTLKPGERWVYQCTLANIKENIRNTATVEARPINPDGTPTNQSPVDDSDVAHVTTELAPKIALKKYVQAATGAVAYSAADDASLGVDAQDATTATFITKDASALYRITVTNTGNTWLDQVVVDDQLANCDLGTAPIDQGDNDAAKTLKPGERWVYQCTLANIKENIRNTATVEARPINPDGTPTNQSPVDDSDVAHVTTELAPKIALKKYVQAADGAVDYDPANIASLGVDAQDATSAAFIVKDKSALYRIAVTNTGNTWLDQVVVDDQLANCDLGTAPIDQGDNDVAKTLKPGERWVYQCTLANIKENIRNTATVEARPINPDGTPTNQSPVDDSDVAHVTTELAPKIALKKYVQAADGAVDYDAANIATLGVDAQDATAAAFIVKDKSALYRIAVTNTGNTWLDQVVVDDQLANCDLGTAPIDQGDNDAAKTLKPGERWVYQCTLANIKENIRNTATVEARPINPDGTPTNQSPVDDSDVAHVTTELAPKIALKKYVQPLEGAPEFDKNDATTLGYDAQDVTSAVHVPYDKAALYRIVVTNKGNTWLDTVTVDDQLDNCVLASIDDDNGNDTLQPEESWVYECTLAKVNEDIRNTATVQARPINPDGTPTNQSPVDASDVAHVTTELRPSILLKKYAQAADKAKDYAPADDSTLGLDAQDETGAAYVMYDAPALYYITVTNTGNTWLKEIAVDDKLAGCNVVVKDDADGDAFLAPEERWVYTCQLAKATQPISNLATVSAKPINPDGTPTNQSPVTSEDVAHIRTHKGHSLGNYLWIDDGNGIALNRDNGKVDKGEKPVDDGVVLELNDASGKPINLGGGELTTTTSGGYYLFSAVPPGEYQVCVAASNFATGGLLAGYLVSSVNEGDPNADQDQNNNGLTPADANGKVCSGIITLDDSEPTKEYPTASGQAGNDAAGSADNASNLSIDFAFVPQEVGVGNRLWIDEGVSPTSTNNGVYDDGEPPLASVMVEVYRQGDDPDVDMAVGVTETDRFGCYSFEHLRPGNYFVHVPYYQVVLDSGLELKPLYAYLSSKGNDADAGIDDTQGENGIDELATLALSGIKTSAFTLMPGQEATGERACGKTTPASLADNSYDGTQDIGVLRYMQLGNYVWFDRNANGIQDAAEVGIENATAELFLADGTTQALDIHGNPVAPVKTDATGKYLFTALAPGDYVVRVTPPQGDYLPTPRAVLDPNNDDNGDSNAQAVTGQVYAQSGVVKLVYDAEPMHDGDLENPNSNLTVDFGFYIPVAVGDRVWLDRNGNGQQDPEDLSIGGAIVNLYAADGVTPVKDAYDRPVAAQTTTDSGRYYFEYLLEGEYLLKVKAPSEVYLPTKGGIDADDDGSDTDSNALPLVEGVSSSLPFTLTARTEPTADNEVANVRDSSSNRSVDFGFIRPLAVGDFIWSDTNANGIQDDAEKGMVGSRVNLLTSAGNPVTNLKGETVAEIVVDETGIYRFEMLMEGQYVVRVNPPADYIVSKPEAITDITKDSNCEATDTVGLFQSKVRELRFNAQPETSVDGDNSDRDMTLDCGFFAPVAVGDLIWEDSNGDGLQTAGEPGILGAKVALLTSDGLQAVDISGNAVNPFTTLADGKYHFDDLLPGDYSVQVTPPDGYHLTKGGADPDEDPSNADSNCMATEGKFQTKVFSLFGGTEPATEADGDDHHHNSTVDCGFTRSTAIGGPAWVDLNADGLQAQGEPSLPGLEVKLTDCANNTVANIYGEIVPPMVTDANGLYRFDHLKAGDYCVIVKNPAAYRPTLAVENPNGQTDSTANIDSNGAIQLDGYVSSNTVNLSWNEEPVNDGDNDPSTNLTIGFGFIPMLAIPTVSEWGLILMSLMLMLAGVYWQRRRN